MRIDNRCGPIYGLTHEQVAEGIMAGFNLWIEKSKEFGFNPDALFEWGTGDFIVETDVLYAGKIDGKHTHYRGLTPRIGKRRFQLHNGFIPAEWSNTGYDDNFAFYDSVYQLTKIVAHEVGHCLGMRHTDSNCLMHPNASWPICKSEAQFFIDIVGEKAVDSNPQPAIIDAVNIPEFGKGSIVIDGERIWPRGKRIVLRNCEVVIYE